MVEGRLFSQALEREILTEVQQHGIVVWLDRDASWTAFVDALQARHRRGEFKVPVVAFRGSYLELLFELEPYGSALDRTPLLIHLPGLNEESIRKTPVLELYQAGKRHRRTLETLVQSVAATRVKPAAIRELLERRPPVTLEQADRWLDEQLAASSSGLGTMLEASGPGLLVDALAGKSEPLAARVQVAEERVLLTGYLQQLTGFDPSWYGFTLGKEEPAELAAQLFSWGAWLLCVEYVSDLRREPLLAILQPLRRLARPVVAKCRELLSSLRTLAPDAYIRLADDVEALLRGELDQMSPEDLGDLDTFRGEEIRVFQGALDALTQRSWGQARAFSRARQRATTFWLQQDQRRSLEWELADEAARFGEALTRSPRPLEQVRTHEEALETYAREAAAVDRAHRHFEQQRLRILEPRLPHYGRFHEVVSELRRVHRTWANHLACDFTRLCRDTSFLPPPSLQQRMVYEQVVHPLLRPRETVALFLVDALRFEMATELAEELAAEGATVDLTPRLAELPTITSVGMNALAPVVVQGKLQVVRGLAGFKLGEFSVRRPDDRARAIGLRSGGKPAVQLTLGELGELDAHALKRKLAEAPLVLVHSREIDEAGEANLGVATFQRTLRDLRSAWHLLRDAGVRCCVFTADHGYLLHDETAKVRPFGTKRDPGRRHIVSELARVEDGLVAVSLASLGYEGTDEHLLLLEDTAVFDTGAGGASFVHGGNSPQERVIPVLVSTIRRAASASLAEYRIEAEVRPDVAGFHRLQLKAGLAPSTQPTLGFFAASSLTLALRVPERDEILALVKDVAGPGCMKGARIEVPVGAAGWTEVFFSLQGPRDERVRVEIFHPDGSEQVHGAIPADGWFAVSGEGGTDGAATPADGTGDWADLIEDPGARRLFLHVAQHGVVTEQEAVGFLGSPRALRMFSLVFDDYLPRLPFKVRTESSESGKRYVKEQDR